MTAKAMGLLISMMGMLVMGIGPSVAQQSNETAVPVVLGPVTGLELPRYVSIKKRAYARRGPGTSYKIDWVYERLNLPLRVVREFGHWRRVVDHEGQGGWIHYALLSNTRYALFMGETQDIRFRPSATGKARAIAQKGVVALLEQCEYDWCEVVVDGHTGWTLKSGLWGVEAHELFE